MRICFCKVNQEFPNSKLNPKKEWFAYWLGWLFVLLLFSSPVRLAYRRSIGLFLIFKWFTLFSCKLSRNKLVHFLSFPSIFYFTSLLTTDEFTLHFFAFHFNTLKHFHLRLLVVNSCCCWVSRARHSCSTSRRHCFCMFLLYNLLLLPLQECEVQWLWMFFSASLFCWRRCECVRVVSSCSMFLSVLAGGCCWILFYWERLSALIFVYFLFRHLRTE